MKRILILTLIVVFSCVGISSAGLYVGAKSGLMMLDVPEVSDIIPIGVLFGYSIMPQIGVEGEFNYGIGGGDWEPFPGISIDYNIYTVAGYGAYRYIIGGVAYVKAKVGVIYENVTAEYKVGDIIVMDLNASDTGLSFGGGIGFKFSEMIMAEAEFTLIEQNVNFISVGLNFNF
ncbi:porin family protein [candidate division WOR-3 bacterium]|nr:porin family protein [candidate division WOR-3 bacterium]